MNKTEILTRDLCGLQLFQRQKDNYFDLGHLIQLYNLRTGENKRFKDFVRNQVSYMKTIYENEVCNSLNDNELSKTQKSVFENSLNDNELSKTHFSLFGEIRRNKTKQRNPRAYITLGFFV